MFDAPRQLFNEIKKLVCHDKRENADKKCALTMNKTFDKVKNFTKNVFHFCCFGSAQVPYGFSHVYSRAPTTRANLAEPYFDDAMHPICDNYDDVEMFVAFSLSLYLISFLLVCQNSNLFQFAIDTFWGGNAITTEQRKREETNWSKQFNTFAFVFPLYL